MCYMYAHTTPIDTTLQGLVTAHVIPYLCIERQRAIRVGVNWAIAFSSRKKSRVFVGLLLPYHTELLVCKYIKLFLIIVTSAWAHFYSVKFVLLQVKPVFSF